MGYAIFTLRKLMLTNQVNTLNSRLMEVNEKRMDLSNYSAAIADGNVDVNEMSQLSGSTFGNAARGFLFNNAGGAMAMANAQVDQFVMQTGGNVTNEQYCMAKLQSYQSWMQQAAKAEQKKIDAMEKKLDLEQQRIQTQLQAAQQELQKVEEAESKAIERTAPKYA